jgi:hypothetical protein
MRTRQLALLYSAARAGIGMALLGSPSWLAERWLGGDAQHPAVGLAVRGLAAREIALGLGAIDAIRRERAPAPWLVAAAAGDLTDMTASLAAGHALPKLSRWGTPMLAGTGAAVGTALAFASRRAGSEFDIS